MRDAQTRVLLRQDLGRARAESTGGIEHIAIVPDEMWTTYGPGAVGVGWDGGVLGLALHLRGGSVGDPVAWQLSVEGRAFATRCSQAWGEASRQAGADAETVARNVANTTAFYAPKPEAD